MSKNRVCLPCKTSSSGVDEVLQGLFEDHLSVEFALSPTRLEEVLALRYQVYCRERSFEDADRFPDGLERDIYDERSVHALVRCRSSHRCIAAVRLVLADAQDPGAPFPMEAHCSQAMPTSGIDVLDKTPRIRVAEISRLAISREIRQHIGRGGPTSEMPSDDEDELGMDPRVTPYIIVGLFKAVLRLSAKLGITQWLAVMEPTLLRLLKRYGIHFPHVGHVVDYHGRRRPTVAQASTLIEGIHDTRPDVWHLMTDSGRVVPARPRSRPIVRPVARPARPPVAYDNVIGQTA